MRTVTRTEEMVKTVVKTESITCDRCGADCGGEDDHLSNEIIIALDQDECVGAVHRRDLCADCSGEAWARLCEVLGIDPDAMERTGSGEE